MPAPLAMERVGVQLYTLRSLMQREPERTLAQIAEIGYREVELAGLYGLTPAEMRAKLDAAGLLAVSSHNSLSEIRDGWERTLEGAQILGQSQIVCPSIDRDMQDADGLARVGEEFSRAGEAARAAGLGLGYHNHSWEFARLPDGRTKIETLLAATDPSLVDWQMDIYWVVDGGGDPLSLIEAHPGRVTSVHVKDRTAGGDMVDVGAGVIDFETTLARAEALGMRRAFVEHDRPGDAVASVRASWRTLNALEVTR